MGTEEAKALSVYEEIALPESALITSHAFNKGNARSFHLVFEISHSMTVSGSQSLAGLPIGRRFSTVLATPSGLCLFCGTDSTIFFSNAVNVHAY